MKYKVGQKVRIVKNLANKRFNKHIGTIATVMEYDDDDDDYYFLDIMDDDSDTTLWKVEEFVAVNRLNKLKRIML